MFVYHNSFDLNYRRPFGAVTCGKTIRLSVFVSDGASARLRVWADEREIILTGLSSYTSINDIDGRLFTFEYTAPNFPCLVWYCFLIDNGGYISVYGANNGTGVLTDHLVHSYQLTVYMPYETPEWFSTTIAYQIFPDRFRRHGERGGLEKISSHTNIGRRVFIHDDWNEDVMFLPFPGEKFYDPCDFFGGDLYGIIDALPYLKSLNVGLLYLNPIFESPSNHRYDTSDYMNIDPMLGGNAAGDALIAACKEFGIRIMLDGVFSHTGSDSVYFNKEGRYDTVGAYNSYDSQYHDWYEFTDYPDTYKCWWGFHSLPEVNENSISFQKYIKNALAKWAKKGYNSWRLDVADELPDEFIRMLKTELATLDKDSVLIGEVWEDASNKRSSAGRRGYVSGDELDGVMNYPFLSAVSDFLLGKKNAFLFCDNLNAQRENYPEPFYKSCLNLLGSHDTVRILTVLGGAPGRDELTRDEQSRFELSAEDIALAKKRMKLAVLIQMSFIGVPMIYYGDEIGMTGMADPFCRRPYNWSDGDLQFRDYYRTLTKLRSEHDCLTSGKMVLHAISQSVIAIIRQNNDESIIAIINRSDNDANVVLPKSGYTDGPDAPDIVLANEYELILFDNTGNERNTAISNDFGISLTLPALSGALLLGRIIGGVEHV